MSVMIIMMGLLFLRVAGAAAPAACADRCFAATTKLCVRKVLIRACRPTSVTSSSWVVVGVPPQISHKIIINRVLFAKLEGAFYSAR